MAACYAWHGALRIAAFGASAAVVVDRCVVVVSPTEAVVRVEVAGREADTDEGEDQDSGETTGCGAHGVLQETATA